MKNKKKAANSASDTKPLVVDEQKFTDVIRGLVNSPPAPLQTIRRNNPETGPRYQPVFDLTPRVKVERKKRKT